MARPDLASVPSFYHNYVNAVKTDDLTDAFRQHQVDLLSVLVGLPEDRWDFRYAPGKWSVKEVIQHLIDAERIFCYRALCFARGETASLPGFDENSYAARSEADSRTKAELIDELSIVQKSSAQLFASFSDGQLASTGIANNNPVPVCAIGFIIVGHTLHHKRILEERYFS